MPVHRKHQSKYFSCTGHFKSFLLKITSRPIIVIFSGNLNCSPGMWHPDNTTEDNEEHEHLGVSLVSWNWDEVGFYLVPVVFLLLSGLAVFGKVLIPVVRICPAAGCRDHRRYEFRRPG